MHPSATDAENTKKAQFSLSPRLDGLDKPTVWHEFSPLAVEHGAINLGQGFPDWNPPEFVIESMERATVSKYGRNANQYTRSAAHMALAEVLAEDYGSRLGFEINPVTEVATAVGATHALYCALQGMLGEGDEVILFEPFFDVYECQVRLAGGVPKFVPLRTKTSLLHKHEYPQANDFFFLDFEELENAISDKTRLLLINNPHNPTGKLFSRGELESIASILRRHPQVSVITDEVYEHVVFDPVGSPHILFASLPEMYDRTLTVSSSGKTFSATGWKIGWAIGPSHLTKAVTSIQQYCSFCAPTPNQDAIALSIQKAKEPYKSHDSFYSYLASVYLQKRNILLDAMHAAGITPIVPSGGFFVMGDTSRIEFPEKYLEETTEAMPTTPMPRDWALSRWMTKEVGVTAIPPSAFYGEKNLHLAKNMLRFAFCKSDDNMREAHSRFLNYFGGSQVKF